MKVVGVAAISLVAAAALITAVLIWRHIDAAGASPAYISEYRRSSDPHTITLYVQTDQHHEIVRTEINESLDRVEVTVWERSTTRGSTVGVGIEVKMTVTLSNPLGQRMVTDRSGHEIPERTGVQTVSWLSFTVSRCASAGITWRAGAGKVGGSPPDAARLVV